MSCVLPAARVPGIFWVAGVGLSRHQQHGVQVQRGISNTANSSAGPTYGSIWLVILVSLLLNSSQFWHGERHQSCHLLPQPHGKFTWVPVWLKPSCAHLCGQAAGTCQAPLGLRRAGVRWGRATWRLLPPMGTIGCMLLLGA